MSNRAYVKAQAQQKTLTGSSPKSSLLQRTCACGQHTIVGGECDACRSKQSTLLRSQRTLESPSAPHAVPGSSPVQENATSSNSAFDSTSYFGHDFSRIPLHSPVQEHGTAFNAAFDSASRFGHDFRQIPIHSPAAGALQTKLAINKPGDEYEQEADRIADQVLAAPAHRGVSGAPPRIQRFSGQSNGQMDAAPANVDQALASPGRPLEPALRQDMEQRFGYDFSRVRVHTDVIAEQSARAVNSLAYTVGRDIVFGAGRFAPESREGGRLLAHELTHVVQQSGGAVAIQRQPVTPDPSAERAAAVAEAEAVARVTTEELEAQSDAEDALKLNWRKRKDKSYAWSLGMKDRARLQKSIELSPKFQQEIAVKVRFFSGEAKAAYIQTISPVLSKVAEPEQITEILEGPISTGTTEKQPKPKLTCDIGQKQFLLEYEDAPEKTRCMDIMRDPEFINNYFDSNIASVVGYSVKGTTWENVQYDSFKGMLVKYKNATSEYFVLDDVGNFYYGGKQLTLMEYTYLKRKNGLVYPIQNGQIYFSELLTPNIISYKNGLKYQTKELQDLYTLLQVGGTFASIMGLYGLGEESFKASIHAFRRSGPAKLPGRPLPGIRVTGAHEEGGGVPEPISEEAVTQRIRAGEEVGEVMGEFRIAGDKALKGQTFERNIYGLSNIHGQTTDIRPIMQLFDNFIQEAKSAGATELRITGNVIRNKNVFRMLRIAPMKFGGTARQTGPMSIEIVIPLR